MVTIQILDTGSDRYTISPDSKILGRMYDENSEKIKVVFPEYEIERHTICTMIVTQVDGTGVDLIPVYNDVEFNVTSLLSQFDKVVIGFSFEGTNYIKNSEYEKFRFLPALKPDNFIPIEPEQREKINLLLGGAFVDVRWRITEDNILEFLNVDGQVVKSIEIDTVGELETRVDALESGLSREIVDRQNGENNLQTQIDAIVSKSDVVDIVGTYADLLAYDTSKLGNRDVIKVLSDNTHSDAPSYYRWIIVSNVGSWNYVGSESITYTKAEIDEMLQQKQALLESGVNIKTINGQDILGEGNIEVGSEVNAYESIEPVGYVGDSFLYNVSYTDLDYGSAYKHFNRTSDIMSGFACSAIVKDGVLGRNFDWFYNNQATFRVITSHLNGRYATTGIATINGLNNDVVESGEYNELYKYLPFSMVDGQNEKGLQCAILVVPNDNDDTVNTPVTTSKTSEVISLNALMLIRYCLDHFATIDEVKTAIADHISIYVPQGLRDLGYECHFIFKDNEKVEVLEFISNNCVWTNITEKPILTNFFVNGVTFKSDGSIYQIGEEGIYESGLTAHAQGLERYNLLLSGLNNDTMTIDQIMTSVKFTQLYKNDWADAWVSEYCGTHGLTIFDEKTQFYQTFIDGQEEFTRRSRDTGTTYQTVHCAIYDNSKLRVYTQENMGSSQSFEFPLQLDAGVHTIVCSEYTIIDGYNVPVVPFRPLLEALTTPFAILNNGTLCITQEDCGKFYSNSLSWIDDNNVVISFVYDNVGILQYKTNLIDTVTPSLYPFNTRAGYYDSINDKFYTTIRFDEELEPSDKALYVDITDINAPVTYLCVLSNGQYYYIKIAGSLVTYVGNFTYNYTSQGGMVIKLPQIPQDDLMRIYNNEKKGITHIIHWTDSDNVDHRFKLLNFKEVTISNMTQYNVTILVSQKYICSYSWSPAGPSSLLLTPNVTEIGGASGTPDYPDLTNKPKINNVELIGNKTSSDLGLQDEITSQTEINIKKVVFGTNYVDDDTLSQTIQSISDLETNVGDLGELKTSAKDSLVNAINEVASIETYKFKGYVASSQPTGTIQEGEMWYLGSTMPTTFPINVKVYRNGAWSTLVSQYTPAQLDLWADVDDNHGYYWFGNEWNLIDVDVSYDDITINKNTSGQLQVKDGGITNAKLNSEVTDVINAKQNITDNTLTTTNKTIPTAINEINSLVSGKSTVSVSDTGTATDEVRYITIDGVEKKLAGGGGGTKFYSHNVLIENIDEAYQTSYIKLQFIDASPIEYTFKDIYDNRGKIVSVYGYTNEGDGETYSVTGEYYSQFDEMTYTKRTTPASSKFERIDINISGVYYDEYTDPIYCQPGTASFGIYSDYSAPDKYTIASISDTVVEF